MASLEEIEKVTADVQGFIDRLRSERAHGLDFERLLQIADEISAHADHVARTFGTDPG